MPSEQLPSEHRRCKLRQPRRLDGSDLVRIVAGGVDQLAEDDALGLLAAQHRGRMDVHRLPTGHHAIRSCRKQSFFNQSALEQGKRRNVCL